MGARRFSTFPIILHLPPRNHPLKHPVLPLFLANCQLSPPAMLHIAPPLPLARGSFPRFGNTPPQPGTWHRDSSFSKDAFSPSDSSVAAGSRSSTSLVSEESSKNLRDSPAPHGEHCALIPGLSDDVALLCLARIGRGTWPACRFSSSVSHIPILNREP